MKEEQKGTQCTTVAGFSWVYWFILVLQKFGKRICQGPSHPTVVQYWHINQLPLCHCKGKEWTVPLSLLFYNCGILLVVLSLSDFFVPAVCVWGSAVVILGEPLGKWLLVNAVDLMFQEVPFTSVFLWLGRHNEQKARYFPHMTLHTNFLPMSATPHLPFHQALSLCWLKCTWFIIRCVQDQYPQKL